MSRLQLLPAIDVVDGQAVRLYQGEAGTETSYGSPLEAAQRWVEGGAEWIHLVDLDAAFGRGSNELIAELVAGADVQVELSRDPRRRLLARAWRRAAAASTSVPPRWKTPEWTSKVIAEHGDKIAVGLDVRGTTLAGRGWTKGGDLWEVLERLEQDGCARCVVTDVTKDGTCRADLDLLREICNHTQRPRDRLGRYLGAAGHRALTTLVDTGVEGAIIGKALYAGQFTLEQALDIAGRP